MTKQIVISRLDKSHAQVYKELRLKALQTDPQAFLSTFTAEYQRTPTAFAYELNVAHQGPVWGYYGLFLDDQLVGFCQISRSYLAKQKHIAFLYNLYVSPDHRQKGYAKKLVSFVLEQMRAHEIERVFISYLAKNQEVRKFYDHFGFVEYGLRPKSVKHNDQYDDEVEMVLEL